MRPQRIFKQTLTADGRARLIVVAVMAAASFLLVAVLVHKLVLNPRYFTLPALVAVIVLAAWLDRMRERWRWLLIAAVVASNLLLLSVGNAHPRWAMEALVDAAIAHPDEVVAGDPVDVRRAALPLRFAGAGRVRYAPAGPGGLAIVSAEGAAGTIVARYPSPPTRAGAILRAIGLEPLIPAPIARRVFAPNPEMLLIRTPG